MEYYTPPYPWRRRLPPLLSLQKFFITFLKNRKNENNNKKHQNVRQKYNGVGKTNKQNLKLPPLPLSSKNNQNLEWGFGYFCVTGTNKPTFSYFPRRIYAMTSHKKQQKVTSTPHLPHLQHFLHFNYKMEDCYVIKNNACSF